MVVRDEDAFPRHDSPSCAVVFRHPHRLDHAVRHRQPHAECRAAPSRWSDYDPPVVGVNDLAHDRESQPGPGRLGGEEGAEQLVGDVDRHARTVVRDLDGHVARVFGRLDRFRRFVDGGVGCSDPDVSRAAQCFRGVDEQIGEHLTQLQLVGVEVWQIGGAVGDDVRVSGFGMTARGRHRFIEHDPDRHRLDLQADRSRELEHVDDDPVRHLGFVDDVGQQFVRVGRVRQLPLEQPRHHLNAGERVLDLVRDRRRHLAQGGQAITQSLPLFQLLDPGQVLEEQRRARHAPLAVHDPAQRVPDRLARRSEPQLRAVRQRRVGEGQREYVRQVVVAAQDVVKRLADVLRVRVQTEDAIRGIVQFHDRPVAPDQEHSVAQAVDDVPIERFSVNHRVAHNRQCPQPDTQGVSANVRLGTGPRVARTSQRVSCQPVTT